MPAVGDHDAFETQYMARLTGVLAGHGLPVEYVKDRAAIDAGLHMYVDAPDGLRMSQTKVWFQAKGKRASTLSAEQFEQAAHVDVRVRAEHLRYWYAAPEAVYLVVYVEAVDRFLAEDVRDIVERTWPQGQFYAAVPSGQQDVTVHVRADATLDADAFKRMLRHRSIRADGPSFRGRPLGHGFDPIRSQIDVCEPDLFERLVYRLLAEHGYVERDRRHISSDLVRSDGRLYQTFEWQSPAFAEYGFGPGSNGFRDDPPVDFVHGNVTVVLDSRPNRTDFSAAETEAVVGLAGEPAGSAVLVVFNGRELSGTGGTWRSAFRDTGTSRLVHFVGLESVTSVLLVATLVYLDFAPEVRFRHLNYHWSP